MDQKSAKFIMDCLLDEKDAAVVVIKEAKASNNLGEEYKAAKKYQNFITKQIRELKRNLK